MSIKQLGFVLLLLPLFSLAQRVKSIEISPEVGVGIALPQGVDNVVGGQNMTPSFRFSFLGQTVGANGQAQTKWIFPRNGGISVGFRLHDMDMQGSWAIRAGVHRSLVAYYFKEPIANTSVSIANWIKDIKYTSYSFDVQRDLGKYYAQLGIRYATNFVQDGDPLGKDTTMYDYSTGNLGKIISVVPLNPKNIIISPEVGIKGIYMSTVPYEIGIGVQSSINKVFSEQMNYTMSNGSTAESIIKYGVSAVFINARVPLTLVKFPKAPMPMANNTKKEKPPKPPKPIKVEKPKKEVVHNDKPQKTPKPPKPAKPKKQKEVVHHYYKPPKTPKQDKPKKEVVDNDKPKEKEEKIPKVKDKKVAKFRVTHTINVQNGAVKVIVRDPNAEDGDIISLYLNGYPLLEDYKVLKKEKVIEITLDEGDNHLIMRAINEGRIPPNTASVTIDDGKTKQSVTLSAQEKKNVALKIVYKK